MMIVGGNFMGKVKFTTTLDAELLKRIKIQAIHEGRSVATIIEELIIEYLQTKKK